MTWTVPTPHHVAVLALAGALIALPAVAPSPEASAAGFGGTQSVLPVPPPADPQTDVPAPPGQRGESYNPNDSNDWWYNVGADGGGGGGGGGG